VAVYERSYRGYEGDKTPEWARFLVLPRYAFQQVFASKAFIVFLVICFLYPLATAVMMYIPHNVSVLKLFPDLQPEDLAKFVHEFVFPARFMTNQGFLAFLLAVFVGPALISADLRNNGLPLYLARPFTRTEYVIGKMSVLAILISAITWIPGVLLFLFDGYLLGLEWTFKNLRMPLGIFIVSWAWILVLSFLSLALSAYCRWKPVARIALVAVLFVLPAFGLMANEILNTSLGRMLAILDMMLILAHGLFGTEPMFEFPVILAAVSLGGTCLICLGLLARKIKAYEVVRG
jgi:ABC-2 type transport system permease protein